MRKRVLLVLIVALALNKANSQADSRQAFTRNSFWTETIFNGSIHKNWKWQLDYQYRRQSAPSDVTGGSRNPFNYDFQHVYRPWIHYQLKENVRLSLSPLGFWETMTPAPESGGVQKIQPEFRICPQVMITNKFGRVIIDQRYRFEYRFIGAKVDNPGNDDFAYSKGLVDFPDAMHKKRIRYSARFTILLGNHTKLENKTFYILAWNEFFLGLGKNTNNDKIWDQNRSFCLLGYKPKMHFPMRFEIGYGLQYVNRFSSTFTNGTLVETGNKVEKNNIFQVYVIFEDFNKILSRKRD